MTQQLPTPGGDDGTWGNMLNGFLEVSHNSDGTLNTSAVSAAGAEMTANKNQPSGYAGLNSSGFVPVALLPANIPLSNLSITGTPSSYNFLRGDGTWSVPPTSSNATTSAPGLIQLAGDLGGSGSSATVPLLANTSNVQSVVNNIIASNATVTGALQKLNNLSDVNDAGSSRANLHVPVLTPAACVAVANVSALSGLPTIDSYPVQNNDLVLLTGQSTASQNGLWLVPSTGTGAWTRPTEFASGALIKGRTVLVMNGTAYANTQWALDTPTAGITIDTTAQTWNSASVVGSALAKLAPSKMQWYQNGANPLTSKAQTAPSFRTDTNCGTTNGSPTVIDSSITSGDVGKYVNGSGVPANTFVGTVTPGVSFLLSSSPTSQVNVNATATGTVSIGLGAFITMFSDTSGVPGILESQWITALMGGPLAGILAITTDGHATPDVFIDLATLFLQANDAWTQSVDTRRNVGQTTVSGPNSYVVNHGLPVAPTTVNLSFYANGTAVTGSEALSVSNITGSTFTITVLGSFAGIVMWEAIANSPGATEASTAHLGVQTTLTAFATYPGFTGFLRFPVPYSTSCTVQLYNNGTSSNLTGSIYYQTQRVSGRTLPYRLYSSGITQANAASMTSGASPFTLFDLTTSTNAWLVWFGLCIKGSTNATMLERPIFFFVDGESTASYQSSGVEDFFLSGYYWMSRSKLSLPYTMLTTGNNADNAFNAGLDILELFGGILFTSQLQGVLETQTAVSTTSAFSYVGLYYVSV